MKKSSFIVDLTFFLDMGFILYLLFSAKSGIRRTFAISNYRYNGALQMTHMYICVTF